MPTKIETDTCQQGFLAVPQHDCKTKMGSIVSHNALQDITLPTMTRLLNQKETRIVSLLHTIKAEIVESIEFKKMPVILRK